MKIFFSKNSKSSKPDFTHGWKRNLPFHDNLFSKNFLVKGPVVCLRFEMNSMDCYCYLLYLPLKYKYLTHVHCCISHSAQGSFCEVHKTVNKP